MAPLLRNFLILLGIIYLFSILISVIMPVVVMVVLVGLIAVWLNITLGRRKRNIGRTWYMRPGRGGQRYW
ncbi:hypothetical protein [Desulfotomaculum copahuensis]|uniref:hypothetical protein n=1 Tax=Desulfotomaculum copahuensis TaxID=1838280 RepID=UPI00124744E2|nr:hypothetical protein [Desulfotomaculum copahuensis]